MASVQASRVLKLLVILLFTTLNDVLSQPEVTPLPGLTEAEVQEIVDAHNFFRGMVDPPASNMQRIQWNVELAAVAQDFAEMCMFRSNPARADDVSFPTVGENLAASNTMSPNYTAFVEGAWFNRSENYDFQTNMCSSPNSCVDYVQLVWAETTEVGCGAAMCQQIDGFPLFNSVLLVCYYAPEGDILEGRPYETGEPCSQCLDEQEFCIMNSCSSIPSTEPPTTDPPQTTTELDITTIATEEPQTEDSRSRSDADCTDSSRMSRSTRRPHTHSRMSGKKKTKPKKKKTKTKSKRASKAKTMKKSRRKSKMTKKGRKKDSHRHDHTHS